MGAVSPGSWVMGSSGRPKASPAQRQVRGKDGKQFHEPEKDLTEDYEHGRTEREEPGSTTPSEEVTFFP